MTDETGRRIAARLAPAEAATAAVRLMHDMTAIYDESLAELIRSDSDGTALRAAGFTAIADALGEHKSAK